MRAKTDEKRQAIIDAATAVFEEVGYQRASMSMISARLGGSKATLYGYFTSKEQLFATCMTHALSESGHEMLSALDGEGDIASVMRLYGRRYLAFITTPEILAIQRTVLTEGRGSDLGQITYELGPRRGVEALRDFFEKRKEGGEIDPPSPEVAALQFKALLEAGVTEPRLYGSHRVRDIDEAVDTAVDAFMKIYGTAPRRAETAGR